MHLCPTCHRAYPDDITLCPEDTTRTRVANEEETAHLTRVGTVVEKYRVDGLVGIGGMGVVYRAVHESLKRPVAVKFIHEEVAASTSMMERFKDEALRLAALNHDAIVAVSDDGQSADGRYFFVMPLLVGESLTTLMRREAPLPEERIRAIGAEIARGLHAAHETNVIHRDLKPDNVFLASTDVDDRDRIKILDFGIARQVETSESKNLTGAGIVLGTPAYMSPEQASGDKLDRRCDLYSLGVILFEMATGRTPFLKETQSAMLMAQVVEMPPAPSEVHASVSSELEQVILRCLHKDPAERYANAAELATALDGKTSTGSNAKIPPSTAALATMDTVEARIVPHSEPPGPRTTVDPVPGAGAKPGRGMLLGLGVAVAVAGGFGIWAALDEDPPENESVVEPTHPDPIAGLMTCPEPEGLRYGGSKTIGRFARRSALASRDLTIENEEVDGAGALDLLGRCEVDVAGFAGDVGALPAGITSTHFADDPVAIVVNREDALRSLTLDELRTLLRGESHQELTLLVPPRASFLRRVLEDLRGEPFPEDEEGLDPGPTVERLRAETGVVAAASWSDVASLHSLRRVKINERGPSTADYPDELVRPLHLLTWESGTRAQELLGWLASEPGQREVAAHRFRRVTPRRMLYGGSSSVERVLEQLLEARVLPEGSIEFDRSSDSNDAPDLLATRRIDLAGYAGSQGREPPSSFEPTLLVNDVLSVVVHRGVRFRGAWLTREQLRGIYSGELTSWAELGGEDAPIVPLASNLSSSARFDFAQLVMEGASYGEDVRAVRARSMIDEVGETEGAIGVISYTFVRGANDVRLVSVDRHTPESPEYPLIRPLWLWTWREAGRGIPEVLQTLRGPDAQCRMAEMRLRSPYDPECADEDD